MANGAKMAMAAALASRMGNGVKQAREAMGPWATAPLTAAYSTFMAYMLDKVDINSPVADGLLTANAIVFPLSVAAGVVTDKIPEGHPFIEKTTQLAVTAGLVALGAEASLQLTNGDHNILNGLGGVDIGATPSADVAAAVLPQVPAAVGGMLVGDAAHKKEG